MAFLYRYNQLNEALQKLYMHLYQGLSAWQEAIICNGFTPQQIHTVMGAVLKDHPGLCHTEGKWEYFGNAALPHYVLAPEAVQQTHGAAMALLDQLHSTSLPQQAYLWLLQQVHYDPAAPNSQNAYGALVQHRAVCKGIAKAYHLLMNLGGIPCILAEGSLDGVTKHVWNMILWQDQWLHVDVTMGYPMFRHIIGAEDPLGGFLLTTDQISLTHNIRNPEALPANRIGGDRP